MKKISVYISNKKLKPSNYYRVYQYVHDMPNVKIHVTTPTLWWHFSRQFSEYRILSKILFELRRISTIRRLKSSLKKDLKQIPDCIVVQKSMTKFDLPCKVKKMQEELIKKTTVIWDFDDDIMHGKEITDFEYNLYCKYAKHIVVTSEFLKNKLPLKCQNRVILLPTTDMQMAIKMEELNGINNIRRIIMQKEIQLVWLATGTNLFHLESIIEELEECAKELRTKENKQLVLKVVSNKKIKKNLKYLKIQNIKWTRKVAIKEVRKASIGIMPLVDTPISRGKGGFKLIQYISTGLPIIASNVGYNSSIFKKEIGYLLDDTENKNCWISAILDLSINNEKWMKSSKNAYEVWNSYYNYNSNLEFWKKILN